MRTQTRRHAIIAQHADRLVSRYPDTIDVFISFSLLIRLILFRYAFADWYRVVAV